jgi:hypothetical protein
VADDAYKRARPFLAVDRKNTIDLDGYFAHDTIATVERLREIRIMARAQL